MLWSSDYPHTGADWPNSWKTIEKHFAGVPEEEKHAILAGNALRLYGVS
jgi:predicted TIM-barrel fold metal-dependent hydrolase